MQKLEENKENVAEKSNDSSWDGFEKWLASEIISGREKVSKAKDKGIVCITILSIFIITGLLLVDYSQIKTNEKNNQRFLEYLSQYDFVSQDGEGTNYYNSDVGGDVNNGTTGTEEEEP